MPDFVYLSPHLDDAVYSCGGLIAQQVRQGYAVHIITVCAGDPPAGPLSPFAQELHTRWEAERSPIEVRRQEDQEACTLLGASYAHWNLPDAVYRRGLGGTWLYPDNEAIFGRIHPSDRSLSQELANRLRAERTQSQGLMAPLGLGGHVDHQLTRLAAEAAVGRLSYYLDAPYVWQNKGLLAEMKMPRAERVRYRLEAQDLQAWIAAAACYRSQLSTFWPDLSGMQAAFQQAGQESEGLVILAQQE